LGSDNVKPAKTAPDPQQPAVVPEPAKSIDSAELLALVLKGLEVAA
jgi:hypothetical protein